MVVIRLARTGSNKNPFYHVVATDKRNSRDGRFIERLGYFDPMARGKATRLSVNRERVEHWINQGAQLSLRMKHLFKESKEATVAEPTLTRSEMRVKQAEETRKLQAAAAKKAAEEAKAEAEAAEAAKAASEEKPTE